MKATSNFTCVVPTFNRVDGERINIQDFKPVGDEVGYGAEALMTYDAEMNVSPTYIYYIEDSGAAPAGDGWYSEEDPENLADIDFGVGIGYVYQAPETPLQYAGEVAKGNVIIEELNAGFTYIGNATPVKKSIQDFVPTGDYAGYGAEALMTYDADMNVSPTYIYYIEDSGAAPAGNGWYSEEDPENLAVLDFEPGEGFVVQTAGDCTITITKVID